MKANLNFRQGDVPLVPFTGPLDGFEPIAAEEGKVVLALGEATGHHHRIEFDMTAFDPEIARLYRDPLTGAQVLDVLAAGGATLLHEEHDPIQLPPGRYQQLAQVEDDGEMIAKVVD